MSDAPKSAPPGASEPERDVVAIGPPTDDGKGVRVLRVKGETLETGELRPLEDGKPVRSEIVTLAPRPGEPNLYDVKESIRPTAAPARKGPPRVSGARYREGWDRIFGASPEGEREVEGAAAPDRSLN